MKKPIMMFVMLGLILAAVPAQADPPTCHFKIYACQTWGPPRTPGESEMENRLDVHVFDGVDGAHLFATWEMAHLKGPYTGSPAIAGQYVEAHCRYSNCDIRIFEPQREKWVHDYCGDISIVNDGSFSGFTIVAGQACTNVTKTSP